MGIDEIESKLRKAIHIISESTKDNAAARITAVRWFNRLFYDLSLWNRDFIKLLQDFPGLNDELTTDELDAYQVRLLKYKVNFLEKYDFSWARRDSEICIRIDFLAARLEKDFALLKEADPDTFYELEHAVGKLVSGPVEFISISQDICKTIEEICFKIFDEPFKSPFDRSKAKASPVKKDAKKAIAEYVENSKRILDNISDEARKVGILLLSVTEYEEALLRDGSLNPQLYVIGEVTMSGDTFNVDNRGGNFNAKSTFGNIQQSISYANDIPEDDQSVLKSLLNELETVLVSAKEISPDDAERIVAQVKTAVQELTRPTPNRGFLKITSQGLHHAATAVANIAPKVLSVTDRIIEFISKYY